MDEKSGGFDSCPSMLAKLMSINPRIFSLKNVHNNTHYAYYLVGGIVPWLWESSKVSVSNFKFSLNHLTVWFAKLCSLRKPQFPQVSSSRRPPAFLGCSSLLHLQSQWHNIFKPLCSSSIIVLPSVSWTFLSLSLIRNLVMIFGLLK